MKIKPIGDKIVLKRLKPREKSPGGIIIPDAAREKPQEGRVVAVGPGRPAKKGKREAPSVNKGDRVLFASYAGTDVDVGDEEFVILEEEDIIGVIT